MDKNEAYEKIRDLIYEMFKKGDLQLKIDENTSYGYGGDSDTLTITIKLVDKKQNTLTSDYFKIDI